jgi:hypothetical protein
MSSDGYCGEHRQATYQCPTMLGAHLPQRVRPGFIVVAIRGGAVCLIWRTVENAPVINRTAVAGHTRAPPDVVSIPIGKTPLAQ